jgi:hypothetical protein
MKRPLILFALAGSLALNAALALRWVNRAPAPVVPQAPAPRAVAPAAPPEITPEIWPSLQPDDLPAHVAQLRAAGFPPNIVRAIVTAQLSASFAARRKALDPDADSRPFWKNHPPDAKLQMAQRQLYSEQRKAMRQLLGDLTAPDDLWSRRQQPDAWANDLPPEKTAEVKRLRDQFDELRNDIYSDAMWTPNLRAKLEALEKEQHDAIAKTLSPAELEAYDLRASNTANQLRSTLGLFDPSEQEFRTLYQLQRSLDERLAPLRLVANPTDEQVRERTDAQKQLTEQIKAALGPERFAEYERTTDNSYQQTARLVARLELPAETADQVWSVQKQAQERSRAIRQDQSLTEAQRNAQLAALGADASGRVAATLGPRAFEAYKDNGGWWIVDLTAPRPAR